MGKLTTDVFNESCCDGGATCDTQSAQPCGCDKGAAHLCERHRKELEAEFLADDIVDVPITLRQAQQRLIDARTVVDKCAGSSETTSLLPTDPQERKRYPIATGVLDYFPDAIVAIAHVSWVGNEQHNPGEPLHWARGKSMDQEDTMLRHFMERGTRDKDGCLHTAKCAWRCLAMLQLEIEAEQDGAKKK